MNRVADFGCCALVTRDDFRMVSLHQQRVSKKGAFRGLDLGPDPLNAPNLDPTDNRRLRDTAKKVAERLLAVGYQGPFGVDAWRYLDRRGVAHFHPLGEINARLTFGFVGRAMWEQEEVSDDGRQRASASFQLFTEPLNEQPENAS